MNKNSLKKSMESLMRRNPEIEIVKTGLPKKLIKRIKVVCENKEMSIQDFVSDAIIEKLELVHKERRKKQRL